MCGVIITELKSPVFTSRHRLSRVAEQSQLLSFDHVYPDVKTPVPAVILYGSIFSPNFRALHEYIYVLAKGPRPKVKYIFRHAPPSISHSSPHYLSGYGVFMDLKKMDYLALDDRQQSQTSAGTLSSFANELISSVSLHFSDKVVSNEETPLTETEDTDYLSSLVSQFVEGKGSNRPITEEEIAGRLFFLGVLVVFVYPFFLDLGSKATGLIMSAPRPLQALVHLSQNFPKYATTVGRRVTPSPEVLSELNENWQKIPPGFSSVWLNGVILQPHDVNIFG